MAEEKEKTEEEIKQETQDARREIAAEEFGTEPPAKEKPEEKEPEEKIEEEVKKPEESEEDLWEGVNPNLKQSFNDMTAKVAAFDSMTFRLKQAENRIGSIQNKLSAAEKAAQEKPPAPTKEEIEKAAAEDKSWEELKDEFPEWAEAVEVKLNRASMGAESKQKEIEDRQKAIGDQVKGEVAILREEIARSTEEREKTLLSFKYPNWETTIRSSEYKAFEKTLPEDMKQLTRSTFAKDAVIVLDKFSETQKNKKPTGTTAERQQRLKESVSVKGKKPIPAKAEADMTREELRRKIAAEVYESG